MAAVAATDADTATATPAEATAPLPAATATTTTSPAAAEPPRGGLFAVPGPIRRLFKLFPLHVYEAEALPARAPSQTFLRIAGVDVELVKSNNHASPSGSLPFLLPASSDPRPDVPLTGSKIERYALERGENVINDLSSPRFEAYLSLLSHRVRPAWLYSLYVDPRNTPILSHWYLPSNPILRLFTRHTLRSAATSEILKTTRRPLIDPKDIFADARTAFHQLSELLGEDDWFFGSETPSLFDAEVFAYTQPIIEHVLAFDDARDSLFNCLTLHENLFQHRQRILDQCYGGCGGKS
ncbi:mitochondrial outer membrane protein (Sam35) [Purpureocillium lavendulum]|uniref:Mitochondrial outer membrane protein (Sam35) n=1 Tax=Purpureocillium lavendulum TaxID=1247861 RepID=A0AB34FLT5_9HYPO|nr:mitochondrial outer membrane protein (Sam35) [Purpureocillium lavendulum]